MRSSPFASLPKFGRASFSLFLVVAVTSAFLSDHAIAQRLVLLPGSVAKGQDLWQPVTANFIYPEGSLAMLVGTLVTQWFVGSQLESFWGPRRYVALVLGCAIVGHFVSVAFAFLAPAVASTPVGGATAFDLAAVAAFGVVFGKRPIGPLPLRGRGLAMLVIGLVMLGPLVRGEWPVVLPWLVAVGCAAAATTQPWRRSGDSGKLWGSKKPKKRHLKVVRPDTKLLN